MYYGLSSATRLQCVCIDLSILESPLKNIERHRYVYNRFLSVSTESAKLEDARG